jgi:hypothetical protein
MSAEDDRLVTVCAACLRASCWQGKFYCQQYRTAGTRRMHVSELRALDREHSFYWDEACERGER